MEKALECGVRFKKELLELDDEQFKERLDKVIIPYVCEICINQRKVHLAESNLIAQKALDGGFALKTVEFYCGTKGVTDVVDTSKGWECGVRIKQFALEQSDDAFNLYLSECMQGFRTGVLEQRQAMLTSMNSKSAIGILEYKDVEVYCSVKNFCG